MDCRISTIPLFFILADAPTGEPWWQLLINGGIASSVIAWFMWRDKLDRDERKQNHLDNLTASKRIENAFRTTTDSLIVGMSAMKSLDQVHLDLLQKLKSLNDAKDDT